MYYVPVEKRGFQDIRIENLRQSGERARLKDTDVPTKIVLHFQRFSEW